MPRTPVKELMLEAFQPYGFYANMTPPGGPVIGKPPIEFYRDMLQLDLGGATSASFSICRVEDRPLVVDVSECHTACGEGILPLDGDTLMHVGMACPGMKPPVKDIEVFRVPRGTMVTLRPGVWHHAPFTTNGKPVNVLIVLPERAYANDCNVVEIPKRQQVRVG